MRIFMIMILGISLAFTLPSCNAKKKAEREAAAEYAKSVARAKSILQGILTSTTMSLDEKEKALQTVKDMKLDDPEVNALIEQVEAKLLEERMQFERARQQEEARKAEEARKKERMENAAPQLLDFFKRIAAANDVAAANKLIDEALTLFATESAPVLLVIAVNGTLKDYDRPLTIRRYLEYVKDQKKYDSQVENMLFDQSGRITELELRK